LGRDHTEKHKTMFNLPLSNRVYIPKRTDLRNPETVTSGILKKPSHPTKSILKKPSHPQKSILKKPRNLPEQSDKSNWI